jgi:ankyrin repeat protein
MPNVRLQRNPGTILAILWACLSGATLAAQVPGKVDFARDVQPVFRDHCIECHGPSQQMRGLRLDLRRGAMPNRVGANRASIVPGNSAVSPMYLKLIGKQAGLRMPPTGPLSQELIDKVKTWIDQGAEWPDALSGDTPTSPPDPVVEKMMSALRQGNFPEFENILHENPMAVNHHGTGGWTPIMYAALYGNVGTLRLLLDKNADPNVRNVGGGSALIYAVGSLEKTRLLLEHGVDANAASGEGRTALLIAAGRAGSGPVVKLLLEHGANPSMRLPDGRTAMFMAASTSDPDTLQLLLDHGADKKPLPLAAALQSDCSRCFEMLLSFADKPDLTSALSAAVRRGNLQAINMLMERGAPAASDLLASVALSPEPLPVDLIRTLISRGADVNARTSAGGSVLDLAKRQGNTPLVDLLSKSGAREEPTSGQSVPKPKPAGSVRAAIEKSIPLLQRADVSFITKAGCVSCHNNSLTAMTTTAARKSGIRVNEDIARAQLRRIASFLDENRELALEDIGIPGGPDTVGYILLGLASGNYPADSITDVWAQYMKNIQLADGHWSRQALRPPLESSEIEVTAAGMRALQVYGPRIQRVEYDHAVQLAVRWLEKAQPKTAEDRAFQILGLRWGGGSPEVIRKAARELLALQRSDGGWGQLPSLASDAYATGQALVALNESLVRAVTRPPYLKGIRFLLGSELEDGSWYVRTRALPIQPYFDSDFPHGPDQFISAAATNWASMALATVVR